LIQKEAITMADNVTMYGDISPRTAAYAWKDLLDRALPGIVTERSAQTKPVPKGVGKVVKFRRYLALDRATTPLAEGVPPLGKKLTYEDIQCVLQQYGDFTKLTDVIQDTHEDDVFTEARKILAEQMTETREVLNVDVMKSGTNVFYANGAQRTDVTSVFTVGTIKKIIRALKRQRAKFFTEILSGSPNYSTYPIESCFIGYAHVDLEADIKGMAGFKAVHEYANPKSAFPYEIGTVQGVRFILTDLFEPWEDAGGINATLLATTNSSAAIDIYPVLILAQNAWATCPLRGADSGMPLVVQPKPSIGNELGQIGSCGWKFWHSGIILNEYFIARLETGATENPV
jgi:N4-gp56 family major capsid protein